MIINNWWWKHYRYYKADSSSETVCLPCFNICWFQLDTKGSQQEINKVTEFHQTLLPQDSDDEDQIISSSPPDVWMLWLRITRALWPQWQCAPTPHGQVTQDYATHRDRGQTWCNALVISSLLWRAFGQNNIWLTRNTGIKGEAVLVSIVAAVTDVLKERTEGSWWEWVGTSTSTQFLSKLIQKVYC